VFDAESLDQVRQDVRAAAERDRRLLEQLREEVRSLASEVRSIRPRSTTAVSLVASDGGNNQLRFDPFYIQLIRVVDSYGKELSRSAVSLTSDTDVVSQEQFDAHGTPTSALGHMMAALGVTKLNDLSHMIPTGEECRNHPERLSTSWLLTYRDLCEWAVLYDRICRNSFGTDTLLVRDGPLRTKIFRGELFIKLRDKFDEAIERHLREDRRKVMLVGVIKHSRVIQRYQLAMMIENLFAPGEARYVRIPAALEAKAYRWDEWARGEGETGSQGEAPKFKAGVLHLVRFGEHSGDPVWAVDIFSSQGSQAAEILGYLLADAIVGFPVPYYPRCLQKAHEHAEVVDWDLEILQDEIFEAIRRLVPTDRQPVLDAFRMNPDPSAARYE
jgi:hypothetical protein